MKLESNLGKPFTCTVCEDMFNASEELTYHYLTHSLMELAHALTALQMSLKGPHNKLESTDQKRNGETIIDNKQGLFKPKEKSVNDIKSTTSKSDATPKSSRSPHTCP